jgi:hypothetical protein
MKTRISLLFSLLVLGIFAALPAGAADTAKEDEMGKIPGITLTRPSGTFLGLEIASGNFKLSFYDDKKKPVPVDDVVARGTARWDNKQKVGSDFTVMNKTDDGKALVGVKFVRPPYNFIVFINLLNAAGDVVESYPVNMVTAKREE